MQFAAGSRITAAGIDAAICLAVIKGSNESVTSSTTLQNDNELVLPVVADATYLFECYLDFEGGTQGSGDLKWTWALPSGATMRYRAVYTNTSGAAVTGTTNLDSDVVSAGTATAGVLRGVSMHGTLTVGATAGSIQLQWAENTSDSTPTIVHAQSSLALWRVS
jgi:hypothetical protein